MERTGYVKLHRQVLDSGIWRNINDWRLAETILLMAHFRPGTHTLRSGEQVPVGRGELVATLTDLERGSGLSRQNVRTSLDHLERADFLTREVTHAFQRISVVNFERFQGNGEASNTQANTDLTRLPYKKNGKKGDDAPSGATAVLNGTNGSHSLNGNDVTPQVPPSPPAGFGPDELADLWNRLAPEKLARVRAVSSDRRRYAAARIKEQPSPDYWQEVVAKISESDFLQGKNDRGWTADFDFLLRPGSGTRILEGKYQSNQTKQGASNLYDD